MQGGGHDYTGLTSHHSGDMSTNDGNTVLLRTDAIVNNKP